MNVKLVSVTPNAEEIIAYCARVSNPANQENKDIEKLLKYCYKHGHYSIFEMANMCIEIKTSRAISAQILRHKSFSFQEFSQRYAETIGFEKSLPRRQDTKNRQNSIDDLDEEDRIWWAVCQRDIANKALVMYQSALKRGIAKECARMILPMSSATTIYMNGSVRSWLHYLAVRCDESTQLEHREIALAIKDIFKQEFPIIGGLI